MSSLSIQAFRKEHIPKAVSLVADSFDAQLSPYMVFTQHGITAFLEARLEYPNSNRNNYALSVIDEEVCDEPLAFADFRLLDASIGFLSYICVEPELRGQGIATGLLEKFVAEHHDLLELQLDVFRDNEPARRLYSELGFVEKHANTWVTRALPAASEPPNIQSLALSLAAHSVYGFSELTVEQEHSTLRVGRLGDTVLKCFTKDDFENDNVLSQIRGMFPKLTTAFAVVPENVIAELGIAHRVIKHSDRFALQLN